MTLFQYFQERVDVVKGQDVSNRALYADYSAWCQDEGKRPLNVSTFASGLRVMGFSLTSAGGVRVWSGLQLKSQAVTE